MKKYKSFRNSKTEYYTEEFYNIILTNSLTESSIQKRIDSIVGQLKRKRNKVFSQNIFKRNFTKKLDESIDKNPIILKKLSRSVCKCGSKKPYKDCCLWDYDFKKSEFPLILQDNLFDELLGFEPRVYSEYELKRSGIKHLNRYELSVLDIIGVLPNKFMCSRNINEFLLLVGLYFDLWLWLFKQENPFLPLQMKLCHPLMLIPQQQLGGQ